MPSLFEVDAKTELGAIELRCSKCVEQADAMWARLCKADPRLVKAARGRGRNSIFNEMIADYAREEFEGDADVDLCEQYGTVRLHVRSKFDLGFKKTDKSGRFANYPTRRHKRYENQWPLTGIGEPLPEAIRLHIGIQWNNAGTEVIDMFLAYPYRRSSLWRYPLATGEAVTDSAKMPAPQPAARTQIRSKIAKDGKAKKAE